VARSHPRLAAAVGLVATFLLLGGPGVGAATADPEHGGGSGRGGNSDWDWGDSRRGSGGGSDDRDGGSGNRRGGDGANGRGNDSLRPSSEAPQTRVGSGRGETEDAPSSSSDPSERSGSDHPGAPSAKFDPPKVTVGNGRTPGVQDREREPRWRVSAPEPAPAPPPPPPPPAPAPEPSWVDRISPPSMPKQLGVAPASNVTDPLWGIAGLLLIPVAGAVLGYRQARASQAAAELGRHP
jgi:hypothetical protein